MSLTFRIPCSNGLWPRRRAARLLATVCGAVLAVWALSVGRAQDVTFEIAMSESPLDKAVRELQPGQPPAQSPLDQAVEGLQPGGQSPLDQAVEGLPTAPPTPGAPGGAAPYAPGPALAVGGGAQLRLADISLDGMFAAGGSTVRDLPLQELEGGGHDPRKRGFTVQQVEFSMMGAVDPYFDGELHLVNLLDPLSGETAVELEEAFMTTRSLPHGKQLKVGHYLTEFGRLNPTHPHAWAWMDQPIINTRVFGPDGMRAPGARLSWLVPGERFFEIYGGIQNANGETMASFLANEEYFEERPIGGRPFVDRDVRNLSDLVYTFRAETAWETCDEQITWLLGASAVTGPNATGRAGNTQIFGLDLTRKWKPADNKQGWPFTIWTSEVIMRRYDAAGYFDAGDPADPADDVDLAPITLEDWGLYSQFLWGFKPRWAVGLRYEFAWGRGDSLNRDLIPVSHNDDPFRDNRHRLSPLIALYLTEFSRFRFQYNIDYAEHLPDKVACSFWLGAEFALGSHPAHKF